MTHILPHRYGHATPAADGCETRAVLAGAYKRPSLDVYLTHTVEVDAQGEPQRVLCRRVKLENICDVQGSDPRARPTCPVCAKRDPRAL